MATGIAKGKVRASGETAMTEGEAAQYLAAMIDGEGTVGNYSGRSRTRRIAITNTEYDIIEATMECCRVLGIHAVVYLRGVDRKWPKPKWDVYIIRRVDLERVLAIVPLRSRCKRDRLEHLVGSYCRRMRDVSPEDLRRMYEDEGMGTVEIAQRLGFASCSVYDWLIADGVPRRDRSAAQLAWRARKEVQSA